MSCRVPVEEISVFVISLTLSCLRGLDVPVCALVLSHIGVESLQHFEDQSYWNLDARHHSAWDLYAGVGWLGRLSHREIERELVARMPKLRKFA